MKNAVSYTNKWMNHYPQFWHEEVVRYRFKIIVVDKADAPKIVKKRVEKINMRRYEKYSQWFFIHKVPIEKLKQMVMAKKP